MSVLIDEVGKHKHVQEILIYWTAPLFIGFLAFTVIVLPDVRSAGAVASVAASVHALHVNKFLFVFVASVIAAVLLQANRLLLWKVLEGYAWPRSLRKWRILRAHIPQCRWLQATLSYERAKVHTGLAQVSLAEARKKHAGTAEIKELEDKYTNKKEIEEKWLRAQIKANEARLQRDRLRKYPKGFGWIPRCHRPLFTFDVPVDAEAGKWNLPYPAPADGRLPYPGKLGYPAKAADTKIMPTLLGNKMRVAEMYGVNQYGLDSQTLWYEVLAAAPASLQETAEEAQLEADTLVCAIYTAMLLACVSAAGAGWRAVTDGMDVKLWVTAAVSLAAAVLLYRRLLTSVDNWAAAIKAVVNSALDPLREKYRRMSDVPAGDEKRMWSALSNTMWYGRNDGDDKELANVLSAINAQPPAQASPIADDQPDAQTPVGRLRHIHQAVDWIEARMPQQQNHEPEK
jgi:hypothetical protein